MINYLLYIEILVDCIGGNPPKSNFFEIFFVLKYLFSVSVWFIYSMHVNLLALVMLPMLLFLLLATVSHKFGPAVPPWRILF